ncbi:flavin reductase family protein [Streptomyces sp. NPDC088400]|uniref:flavin reductase family protein n=1 Tax=Streptomyces sp. NPDC088400 TaxID=3365861 RepID=UPI00382417E8
MPDGPSSTRRATTGTRTDRGTPARSGIDRFAGVPWTEGHDGLPVLDRVPVWLTARVTLRQHVGDHLLVVGEVDSGGGHGEGPALVHHDGAFATDVHLPPHNAG